MIVFFLLFFSESCKAVIFEKVILKSSVPLLFVHSINSHSGEADLFFKPWEDLEPPEMPQQVASNWNWESIHLNFTLKFCTMELIHSDKEK